MLSSNQTLGNDAFNYRQLCCALHDVSVLIRYTFRLSEFGQASNKDTKSATTAKLTPEEWLDKHDKWPKKDQNGKWIQPSLVDQSYEDLAPVECVPATSAESKETDALLQEYLKMIG